MKDIAKWTKHFLEKGYSLSESRVKAKNKLAYLKECEEIEPSQNRIHNGVYQR